MAYKESHTWAALHAHTVGVGTRQTTAGHNIYLPWASIVAMPFDDFGNLRDYEGQRQAPDKRSFHKSSTHPLIPLGAFCKCNALQRYDIFYTFQYFDGLFCTFPLFFLILWSRRWAAVDALIRELSCSLLVQKVYHCGCGFRTLKDDGKAQRHCKVFWVARQDWDFNFDASIINVTYW